MWGMAASSFFALIDDVATLLDDVALLSKVAAKKTAGVLGDDLALNAQQVSGVDADRELPVVWAVARGSLLNKAILVPAALAVSSLLPWLVTPLLMIGGAYLCFEGFEKLAHRLLHSPGEDAARHAQRIKVLADPQVDLLAFERQKIKGAVRTDFILSAEIITITLGTVAQADFTTQLLVLCGVSVAITAAVYGVVAAIVKLDDLGLWLSQRRSGVAQAFGRGILAAAPWLMKALSVGGTAAMFLVGGGILLHGVPPLAHAVAGWIGSMGGVAQALLPMVANAVVGLLAGALVLGLVLAVQKVRAVGAARHDVSVGNP